MSHKIITWDEYFMGVAKLSSFRSKDPNTQVGACIVNPENKIVGVGYNGLPWGCEDTEFPWSVREGNLYDTKYPYVVHAELNAILNSTQKLNDCRIYVSLFPCHECAKAIIQSGIKEIVYEDDKYDGTSSNRASKRMLDVAKVRYRQIKGIDIEVKEG
jgi:dCMP deaminase